MFVLTLGDQYIEEIPNNKVKKLDINEFYLLDDQDCSSVLTNSITDVLVGIPALNRNFVCKARSSKGLMSPHLTCIQMCRHLAVNQVALGWEKFCKRK